MRPYINMTDEALVAKIEELSGVADTLASGGIVSKVAGEGRLVEYTRGSAAALATQLRMLGYEARLRRLPIGGEGGAIRVVIG